MTYILSVIGRMKYIIFDMSVITRALEEKKQGSVIKKKKQCWGWLLQSEKHEEMTVDI